MKISRATLLNGAPWNIPLYTHQGKKFQVTTEILLHCDCTCIPYHRIYIDQHSQYDIKADFEWMRTGISSLLAMSLTT